MELLKNLEEAGLTGNESKVYLELVKKGELSANQIAKNLGMDRTLSYTILNHLMEKGQVSYVIKENKKFFSASPPEALLNNIKMKETLVSNLVNEISKIKPQSSQETEINVYEGTEGIRTIMRIFLKLKNSEFVSFGGTGRVYDLLYEAPSVVTQIEKLKNSARIIMNSKYRGHEFTKHKSIQTKFLDIESESTTSMFSDYISIHLIKEKPIIILIKNKDIAQSYKNYFEFLWKSAEK